MKSAAYAQPPLKKKAGRRTTLQLWMRVSGASEQIHFAQLINPHTQLPPALSAGGIKTRARVCAAIERFPASIRTQTHILMILIWRSLHSKNR